MLPRSFFEREVTVVARDLLGHVIESRSADGAVSVRLTEVEAYAGLNDPASHAFRGRTPRTAVMFGPAGHLYTYFVYGMHWCANVVTGRDGDASAVLLRAGIVVDGIEIARSRRPRVTKDHELGRGPAALTTVLALSGADTGTDLCSPQSRVDLRPGAAADDIQAGPRVGVSTAVDVPWRFWASGESSVTSYKRGTRAMRGPAIGGTAPGSG